MLPSAAEIPPCAAEVWLLVGNTFEIQAVFNPASDRPTAALSPDPVSYTHLTLPTILLV